MKKLILSAFVILSSLATFATDDANTKMGKKLIIEELINYSDDYGVEEVFEVDFQGVIDRHYSFAVTYSKQFCFDSGDDERMSCALYKCQSNAVIDGDAVVGFESESKRSNCEKIAGSDTTLQY
ncbi:MAG: hypothetical protein A2622_05800 [Bdellovibrionales bacterium RIFCSPHIGHO2_01_FULL_40_29]|nr:MAG: hypothetical protein A2622_05800 [Bdellovibrionales bacterium RIFCSPHIGHO2_01_FULL_40_29]OFZ34968.1 MAG: hypothetical protein A3D17_06150 [Bdellovibrionales bacterium RIFCSPHIGHO2_02_FULL_40_15]